MTNDRFRRRAYCLLSVLALILLAGCEDQSRTSSAGKTKKSAKEIDAPKFYGHLLPRESVGYVRITNVKKVIAGFVDPKHLRQAEAIRTKAFSVLMRKMQELSGPDDLNSISTRSKIEFLGNLKSIHVGLLPGKKPGDAPRPVVFIDMLGRAGLETVHADLKPKLVTKTIGKEKLHVIDIAGSSKSGFAYLSPTSVVYADVDLLEATIERKQKSTTPTLADDPGFKQATKELGEEREVFGYLRADAVRPADMPNPPFAMVSHVACSLGTDGGLTLRAYAKDGMPFPRFLVRTPREKKFLSRIPADAAFLLSRGVAGEVGTQRNFVEWLLAELGQKEQGKSVVAEQWRKLAKAYSDDPKRVENEVFSIVEEIWLAAGPMKSESAMFVAPDANGRWGAGFLFDVADETRVQALTKKVFAAGKRAKLPWKKLKHHGLTIHYIDFTDVAKSKGSPVPPEVLKHAQLRVGYAAGKEIFYAGTVEAIKFAHQPTGKTLDKVIDFANVDEKNAIMISLLPGRVLHRTFGVPKVDNVLTRLAAQIPKNSNYTLTLNFAPQQLTFRTNIPFISLGAWAAVEFFGEE